MYAAPEREMKNCELKECLNKFPDDSEISVILANPRKRKLYKLEGVMSITDLGQPVFCIDVGEESDMDEEMVAACEESERNAEELDGQMDITDFPEVLP